MSRTIWGKKGPNGGVNEGGICGKYGQSNTQISVMITSFTFHNMAKTMKMSMNPVAVYDNVH